MSLENYPYTQTTHDIAIGVLPLFLDDQSDPEESQFVWAYTIRIENKGAVIVQLKTRHWIISDGHGRVQEVKGDGVVGEQPILKPGTAFEYSSGCPLTTPTGIMRGTYQMVDEQGTLFEVAIPAFSLDSPYMAHTVN